jgi:FMN phosphatase YigB (HAD superfamily)
MVRLRRQMMESNRGKSEWIPGDGITTVFFDFDGTLVFHEPDSFDIISAFCASIGQPLNPCTERRGRRIRHQYFVDPIIREQLNGLSGDDFWNHFNRHLLAELGIEGDLDRFAQEISAQVRSLKLVHHCPQVGCQTLSELRARGYGLGLITNRDNVERFYELFDALGLRPHFDMALASGEVGIRKPAAGIFDIALARMGVQARESIYVGDNYWADILGAQNAGVNPVLLDPHHLFPEAMCPRLDSIDELLSWLA